MQCLESTLHRGRHGESRSFFIPYFLVSLKLLDLTTPGEIPPSLGLYARCRGLIELLSFCQWLRRVTSTVIPMSLRIWGSGSIPSDHAALRVVFHKPTIREHLCKHVPSWMSKYPDFCSILKRLDDDHQYPVDPFCALADFKTILEKA